MMIQMQRTRWLVIFLLSCATARLYGSDSPTTAPATQPSSGEFLQYVDDGKGGAKLQTAIMTYRNDGGVTVHLVAALHVGEKSYYDALAKTFDGYDALLYEMVKPKGSGVPVRGQPTGSMIGAFQRWLKNVLELDYQLDDIDYSRPNFVHADLDWETFEQLQTERGESVMSIMMQSMIHQWAKQMESGDNARDISFIDLLVALRSPDRARQFKLLLAQSFGDIEDQMAGMTGPDGSVIITERNKKALQVLKDTIDAGKKNIGIFYGAGHMSDMEKRLDEMGFHRFGKPEWRVGWDMTAPPETKPATAPANEKVRPGDVEDFRPDSK